MLGAVEESEEERTTGSFSRESNRDWSPRVGAAVEKMAEVVETLWTLLATEERSASGESKVTSIIWSPWCSPGLAGVKTMTVLPIVVTKSRKPNTVSVT